MRIKARVMFMTTERVRRELEQRRTAISWWQATISACRSLSELLAEHRRMWTDGIRCPNFGPDQYGFYRTENIASMKADEVYLGGIYGLFTLPLPEWEKIRETHRKDYSVVMFQYRNNLLANLRDMMRLATPTKDMSPRKTLRHVLELEKTGIMMGAKHQN